jgi:hypothetical protein
VDRETRAAHKKFLPHVYKCAPVPLHAAHDGRGGEGGRSSNTRQSEERLGRGERGEGRGEGKREEEALQRHRKALKFLEHAAKRETSRQSHQSNTKERGEGREEEAVQRHRKALKFLERHGKALTFLERLSKAV